MDFKFRGDYLRGPDCIQFAKCILSQNGIPVRRLYTIAVLYTRVALVYNPLQNIQGSVWYTFFGMVYTFPNSKKKNIPPEDC